MFGYFRCGCGKRWNSAATWKDKWQKCRLCEAEVYPHEQHPLESRDNEEPVDRRPHDMARCQKCSDMGRLCMPDVYY